MRRRTQADRTYARLREGGETTTRAEGAEEGGHEKGVGGTAGSEWEEAMSESDAAAARGDGESTGRSWHAALRGAEVLGWVKEVCRGGTWAERGDEMEAADMHAEIRQRHGVVTVAELRRALGEAEEADMVLVRGDTVHFI